MTDLKAAMDQMTGQGTGPAERAAEPEERDLNDKDADPFERARKQAMNREAAVLGGLPLRKQEVA